MVIEDITIDIQKTTNSRLPETDVNTAPFGKIFSDHMFEMEFADGEWSNPVIKPFQDLVLSPASMVFHYAQAIFEGMKAYKLKDGEISMFRPMDNIRRMNISAERMSMPTIPENVFFEALKLLLDLDREWVPTKSDSSLYIRPFMIATNDFVGVKESIKYKFIIFTSPANAYYSAPVRVKIETYYSRACKGGTGFAKAAGNYAASLYPAKLAKQEGYDQLIWTDAETHTLVEEAGTMNVMFVIDGVLVTPPSSETILDSITRKSVVTLAEQMNIPVQERIITVEEVVDALEKGTLTEAFGAGTAATLAPICTIAFEGKDYDLAEPDTWTVSPTLLKRLTEIRLGEYPDENNWLVRL